MKVLVPVKRVVDYNVKVRVKSDGSGVELSNVKMSMNPFDEIAVEEALRLREAGKATEVVVVSIGPRQASETIRTGLAMGADRGILVRRKVMSSRSRWRRSSRRSSTKRSPALSFSASRRSTTTRTRPVRCWPPCSDGRRRRLRPSSKSRSDFKVTREVDGGLQTVKLKGPAIVTTDLRLNEPRYASLPNIMKAKKKPIADKTAADYSVDLTPISRSSRHPNRRAAREASRSRTSLNWCRNSRMKPEFSRWPRC